MEVSTVALSKTFMPFKSMYFKMQVFFSKNSRKASPYPARVYLLEVMKDKIPFSFKTLNPSS